VEQDIERASTLTRDAKPSVRATRPPSFSLVPAHRRARR
jgi:hypothetical protein